jgi:glyceraldehyde 3-phosphate dehydrogenase
LLDADGLDVVAVNDIADADNLAYLIKYDTVYGRYHHDVTAASGALVVDGNRISTFAERDPANLPWHDLGVDLVLECTGAFTSAEDLDKHVQAGASYVILSAPTNSETVPTVVHGVNRPHGQPQVISCASCTTNCITPVIEVSQRRLGVERAVMTTIHAYTAGQQLVDGPSSNFRRGRAGAANLVPTSTGAARAISRALPQLAGRFDGIAVRAPIPVGSVADIVFVTSRPTTTAEVNDAFRQEAATARYQGHPRCLRGSVGLRGHRRRPTRRRHRPRANQGRGRHAGQGDGLVRQRMGLHPPDDPRGPQHPRPVRHLVMLHPSHPRSTTRPMGENLGSAVVATPRREECGRWPCSVTACFLRHLVRLEATW